MDYISFKNAVLDFPIISNNLMRYDGNTQALRNQLGRWREKGLLIKLKNGYYILNLNERKINPSKSFIANQLYYPSYVSLEYALGFYGLIPERVIEVTSVTTMKTARFENPIGAFRYQHIKPAAFRGFKYVRDEADLPYFVAEPEKAIVDFLYLNLEKFTKYDMAIFEISYRFQNIESLTLKKISHMARLFRSDKLEKVSRLFCDFARKEMGH